ncbi:cold shock and DUF1294 domain-containing protein [Leptolyngbya sp. FACHB-671]|uniref:DUF1294 domain-containing protein n=1 Tax=Leptolyngbya sp. FACHB-671 TaxID=2692812 RepID=UPI0016828027|nr:cold shock and DUF1294 domain-containing protein [Leptolyngbya sp. FACHB-671]MBD2067018.1 cold shock and DUF1294 domain-containing protein [Leptolyngbya sp. FACHB-671]
MEPVLVKGQLRTWKDAKGFGFIQPADGSQEIFLHISQIKDSTRRPKVGDTIYYYAVAEDGKFRAHKAFILGARRKPTLTAPRNKALSSNVSLSPFPVLETLLLSILPLVGSLHFTWATANPLPLILYPVMSLLTFALYADDKSRAKRRSWRTPEKTLHLCELAGGWLGGFVAQRRLHHKSSKESYQFEFWVIVALHYIAWLGWLFFGKFITA